MVSVQAQSSQDRCESWRQLALWVFRKPHHGSVAHCRVIREPRRLLWEVLGGAPPGRAGGESRLTGPTADMLGPQRQKDSVPSVSGQTPNVTYSSVVE